MMAASMKRALLSSPMYSWISALLVAPRFGMASVILFILSSILTACIEPLLAVAAMLCTTSP